MFLYIVVHYFASDISILTVILFGSYFSNWWIIYRHQAWQISNRIANSHYISVAGNLIFRFVFCLNKHCMARISQGHRSGSCRDDDDDDHSGCSAVACETWSAHLTKQRPPVAKRAGSIHQFSITYPADFRQEAGHILDRMSVHIEHR